MGASYKITRQRIESIGIGVDKRVWKWGQALLRNWGRVHISKSLGEVYYEPIINFPEK
jgi:hypothetical protein